jgi:multiple sugar transport system ATP-binding protein
VLEQGRIIQVGTPDDIYDQPATTFIAQLVGTPRINLFSAGREDGGIRVRESELRIALPAGADLPQDFQLGIRPEDIQLDPDGDFSGTIELTEPLGVETILHIRSGNQTLLSTAPGMTRVKLRDQVRFRIRQDRLHCFDLAGRRLG